jgi:hypothetical protein
MPVPSRWNSLLLVPPLLPHSFPIAALQSIFSDAAFSDEGLSYCWVLKIISTAIGEPRRKVPTTHAATSAIQLHLEVEFALLQAALTIIS